MLLSELLKDVYKPGGGWVPSTKREPLCCHRNKPIASPLREHPLALMIFFYPFYPQWQTTLWLFIQFMLCPPHVLHDSTVWDTQCFPRLLWWSQCGSLQIFFCSLVLIWSRRLVSSDNPEGEHRPGFMMPLGATSTKMVLRGETLELECIAEGL